MTSKPQIGTILDEIEHSFPTNPVPTKEDLISHQCEECFSLRDDFNGYMWSEVPREIIEIHFQDIPLFTKAAFQYYIPTYLSYSLNRHEPTDEEWVSKIPPALTWSKHQPILDLTIYALRRTSELRGRHT